MNEACFDKRQVDRLLGLVAAAFEVSRQGLLSPTRRARVVLGRHCAMALAHDVLGLDDPTLALAFGRDRTAVYHARQAAAVRLEQDAGLREVVDFIASAVRSGRRSAGERGRSVRWQEYRVRHRSCKGVQVRRCDCGNIATRWKSGHVCERCAGIEAGMYSGPGANKYLASSRPARRVWDENGQLALVGDVDFYELHLPGGGRWV